MEKFEDQAFTEEPVTSESTIQRRIRPQRFLAGAGRYANKLLVSSRSIEEQEPRIEEEAKEVVSDVNVKIG